MDIVKENDNMISVHFDSILSVIEEPCISKCESNVTKYNHFLSRTRGYTSDWFGPGMDTAKNVITSALIGNSKFYKKHLEPKLSQLFDGEIYDYEEKVQRIKRKVTCGMTGDELDIHKVYQGKLDKAWRKTERVEVEHKLHLVTLLIEYQGNSGARATSSLWRSAVAVKLAGEIERAGKSVQIVVGSLNTNAMHSSSKLLTTSFVIKRFNEKLNLERVAAMTHLGFYRVAGFCAICSQDNAVYSSLGYATSIREGAMPIHLQEEVDAGHTKFVKIGMADSLQSARQELANCYAQMKEFATQK